MTLEVYLEVSRFLTLYNHRKMLLLLIISLLLYVSSFNTNTRNQYRSNRNSLSLSSSQDDFITSFVKRFLPTPEDVGLTRSGNRVENYPAVLDKYAEILKEDGNDDRSLIRQTLAQTNLEFRPLKVLLSLLSSILSILLYIFQVII